MIIKYSVMQYSKNIQIIYVKARRVFLFILA